MWIGYLNKHVINKELKRNNFIIYNRRVYNTREQSK